MGNPFYIPRQQSRDMARPALEMVTRFNEQESAERIAGTRARLMQEQNDLTRQGHELKLQESRAKYGSLIPGGTGEGMEGRRTGILETQAKTEAMKAKATAGHMEQFGDSDVQMVRMGIKNQGLEKPFSRVLTDLDGLAKNPKYTKGETYLFMKTHWPEYQRMILQDIQGTFEKSQSPVEKEQLQNLFTRISQDQEGRFVDAMMPGTVRAMALENAALSAKNKEALSPLGKLVREYNALEPGDPNREAYKGAIAKQAQSEGLQLSTNPDGTFTLTQGAIGQGGTLTKPVQTKMQEKAIGTADNIARLEAIGNQFDPSFMEIETRLGNTKTKWKEKLGMDVSPDEKEKLSKYSAFSRDAVENINAYIKEITGAQMSEKEADRISKAMPDPGDGIFSGDSPTEFKAKWRSAMKALKLSQARATYLLRNGVSDQALIGMAKTNTLPSFSQIEETIKGRNIQLEQEMKARNPAASRQEIDVMVAQQLKAEFGI